MRDQQAKMTSPKPVGSKIIMFLTTAMLLLAYTPANADQNDPKLDKLFAALQTSLSNASAASLEREIWAIWTRYPDDQAINYQMDRAIKMIMLASLMTPKHCSAPLFRTSLHLPKHGTNAPRFGFFAVMMLDRQMIFCK